MVHVSSESLTLTSLSRFNCCFSSFLGVGVECGVDEEVCIFLLWKNCSKASNRVNYFAFPLQRPLLFHNGGSLFFH